MKYLELNVFTYYTVDAKRPKKLVKDALHFFLYIINPKKYSGTFQLRALCVRARTMNGLEMHLMFCYNEFWIYLHICSLFNSFLLYRVNKIRGWPLNRGRTVLYPLDNDLSSDSAIQHLNIWDQYVFMMETCTLVFCVQRKPCLIAGGSGFCCLTGKCCFLGKFKLQKEMTCGLVHATMRDKSVDTLL